MRFDQTSPVLVAAAATLVFVFPALCENLSAQQIKDLIGGRRIFLDTPFGIELPLHYRQDGSVSGDVARFSAARMIAPRETGKWWIEGESLCQVWPTWYKGKQFCFTIETRGENTIFWRRDDGTTGTARIGG
jgi:hypothetical protein